MKNGSLFRFSSRDPFKTPPGPSADIGSVRANRSPQCVLVYVRYGALLVRVVDIRKCRRGRYTWSARGVSNRMDVTEEKYLATCPSEKGE